VPQLSSSPVPLDLLSAPRDRLLHDDKFDGQMIDGLLPAQCSLVPGFNPSFHQFSLSYFILSFMALHIDVRI
jgi:hypothetical protein